MGLFSRRSRSTRDGSEPQAGVAADERATSGGSHTASLESYPKGTALTSAVVHVVLWTVVGLAALGGIGFVVQLASGTDEVVAAAPQVAESDPLEQRVSAYALSYTTAWLAASKENAGRLESFVTLQSTAGLSEQPWQYRDPVVDQVDQLEDELYTVQIMVWIEEPLPVEEESDEDPEKRWVLRAFRSTIQDVEGSLIPVGFPAPVAVETGPAAVVLDYPEQLRVDSTAGAAVHDFLMAYVTGTGDISRFIAPEASITEISPAPYNSVTIRSIFASAVATDAPSEGEEIDVFVDVVFTAADGRSIPATYVLSLSSRAERWEIAEIHTAPLISPDSDPHSTSEHPSPSSPAPAEEPSETPTP